MPPPRPNDPPPSTIPPPLHRSITHRRKEKKTPRPRQTRQRHPPKTASLLLKEIKIAPAILSYVLRLKTAPDQVLRKRLGWRKIKRKSRRWGRRLASQQLAAPMLEGKPGLRCDDSVRAWDATRRTFVLEGSCGVHRERARGLIFLLFPG